MYSYASLNKKNIQQLVQLNRRREQFNILNEDFWEYYCTLGLARQLIAARRLKLLECDNEVIGYLWLSKQNRNSFYINSMFVNADENLAKSYGLLLNGIRSKAKLLYKCEKNSLNYSTLSELGFVKKEGTYEMHAQVPASKAMPENCEITFEQFVKGKHEEVRCRIQNEAFKNDTRIPLTREDIYCDELQSYYYEKGSVLVKKGDSYIGYGQIIFSDLVPTIVNVGFLEDCRGKGYGRALMHYLFKILAEQGVRDVKLRVSTNNHKALRLYQSLGFSISNEAHLWEYKK